MKKKLSVILSLLLVGAMLSSCTMQVQTATTVTLPETQTTWTAPSSDLMTYTSTVPLYLPSSDGRALVSRYAPVSFTYGASNAETLLRTLIRLSGDSSTRALSSIGQFSLYGPLSVVVSGGICTVNLTQSALKPDRDQLYAAAMAMTATLCESEDIHHVLLLITDQAPGMDISGNLPLGLLSAKPGENLNTLWESLLSRRTPLGSDPSAASITSTCALYFPVSGQDGVVPEVRSISFPGQTPQQLVSGLLDALSAGSQYLGSTCVMPDIDAMMAEAPEATDMLEGGRMISLRFREDLRDQLSECGITLEAFVSSLMLTITGFVPSVSTVRCYIGDELLTSLDGHTFRDGLMRRTDFASNQLDQATLYFARNGGLTQVTHYVTAGTGTSPRRLLFALMQGPTNREKNNGISSVLPGGLNESDIIGMEKAGDTLLINLSANFENGIRALYPEEEKLCCYAIVNTLCEALDVRRVVFFFQGQNKSNLNGVIDWSGEFMMNPAILSDGRG